MSNLSVRSIVFETHSKKPPLALKPDVFGIRPPCRAPSRLSLKKSLEVLPRIVSAYGHPSLHLARKLLELSGAAYKNPGNGLEEKVSEIKESLGNPTSKSSCDGFELRAFHRASNLIRDTEVILATNGHQEIVVAFRGSETDQEGAVRDWVGTDGAAIIRKRYDRRPGSWRRPNKIHRGFYKAFLDIVGHFEKKLLSLVKGARNPHLYFTGHSLGGALATIAAMDFAVLRDDGEFPNIPITLYTFGSPRCLNYNCQQSVLKKVLDDTFAIVNDNDRVPGLPPVIQGNLTRRRYSHIDHVVVLDDQGDFKIKKGDDYKGKVITGPVGGHRVGQYRKRLKRYVM